MKNRKTKITLKILAKKQCDYFFFCKVPKHSAQPKKSQSDNKDNQDNKPKSNRKKEGREGKNETLAPSIQNLVFSLQAKNKIKMSALPLIWLPKRLRQGNSSDYTTPL